MRSLELGVSRNTVVAAFEQLVAEGYLESRTGDGTYVSRALPDDMLSVRTATTHRKVTHAAHSSTATTATIALSKSAQALYAAHLGAWAADGEPRAFRPDMLALDHFPFQVTSGSQQGIDLATRTLLNPGDSAWMEDPGYRSAKGALIAVGAKLIPVPVDEQGLRIDAGETACPNPVQFLDALKTPRL
jgi:GntR family transcriptional regulator/MocR family aminotransferase